MEGFSSPLWTLGLAATAALGGPRALPAAALVLGLLSLALSVVLVGGVVRRVARGNPPGRAWGAALFSATLVVLAPTVVFYSVTGLETLLFAAAVLAVAGSLAGVLPPPAGLVAAGLSVWIRPEGPWLLVAAVAQLAAQGRIRKWRRSWLPLALALAAGGLSLLIVRLSVFGGWFPNTFHAKTPSLESGLGYLLGYFTTLPGMGLLVLGGLGAFLGSGPQRGFFGAALAWMAAAVLEGGDWMPLGRFLVPALVLLILAASGVVAGGQNRSRLKERLSLAGLVLFLAASGIMLQESWKLGDSAARTDAQHCQDARLLAAWVSSSGASSVALVDIGRMGFGALQTEILDLGGLTDRTIAAAPGGLLAKRFDPGYLFDRRRPDLVVIRLVRLPGRDPQGRLAPRPPDALARVEQRLLADPRMKTLYRPLFVLVPPVPREPLYARMVFIRRGVVIASGAMPPGDMLLASELGR